MRIILPAVLCILLPTPAFAQSLGEKTGVDSLVGAAPSTSDFVTEAAQSDMFEIQSSQLAAEKGSSAVKAFATQMIADHTKTSAQVKDMVHGGVVKANLPSSMSGSQESMLDKLKGLSGDASNKQYGSDQVTAHKEAVDLFQRYSTSGKNTQLKTFTSTTLPTLQHHLEMANSLPQ
jgi:putative membrane protein